MEGNEKKEIILDTVKDLVGSLLWDDRKEDEKLPRGEIEKAIEDGTITEEEIVEQFKDSLREYLKSK